MTRVQLDGTKVGNKRYDTSTSSFSLGVSDLGATICPKRLQRVKMHLDTGSAVNTLPLNIGSQKSEMEDSMGLPVVNGFQMEELRNSKDTTKTDCSGL